MKREARRVSRFVSDQVWAIRESTLDVIVEVLRMRAAGITLSKEEVQARIGAGASPSASKRGAVAVLPLVGVISPKINAMTEISGGTSLDIWMKKFREYRDDESVSAIVLDVDSPGGSVFGVVEAADEIFRARAVKPILAAINPECGSAALWLAAMAGEVVCTPSGSIGSLGCFCVHEDWSKANELMGMKPTYIAYGEYKVEGHSDAPMSDETLAYVQSQVNTVGESFVKSVARGRGVSVAKVKADFGRGRMLLATDALAAGMIDRIATLDETVAKMTKGRGRSMAALTSESRAARAQRRDAIEAAEYDAEHVEPTTASVKATDAAEMVEPEDGECPEGYEMGEDGMCHVMPAAESQAPQAMSQRDPPMPTCLFCGSAADDCGGHCRGARDARNSLSDPTSRASLDVQQADAIAQQVQADADLVETTLALVELGGP